MATTSSPYGLVPINLIGGQSFTGGSIRDYVMTVNSATAIFKGDIVAIGVSSGGQPTALAATPTTSTRGLDRKSTRLNSSHSQQSRMPSSA